MSDCCSTPNEYFISYIIGEQVAYDEYTLSWIFIFLVHWYRNPRVDMSFHSDTLSLFRVNQSLLLLSKDGCLPEKQHTPTIYSLVWLDWSWNPRPPTLKVVYHCTTDAVLIQKQRAKTSTTRNPVKTGSKMCCPEGQCEDFIEKRSRPKYISISLWFRYSQFRLLVA